MAARNRRASFFANNLNPNIDTATLEILKERRKITPREQALRDMRKEGLNTIILKYRKIVVIEEEYVFCSIDDGRTFNGGKRVKRTINHKIDTQVIE